MAQKFKPLPLPFAEFPSTPDNSATYSPSGANLTITSTLITLPSGQVVKRSESYSNREPDYVTTNFQFSNQTIHIRTTPNLQSVDVTILDTQGVEISYSYTNYGDQVIYTVNTGGNVAHGTSKRIYKDEFINSVSGLIGASAQSWTMQLKQIMPEAGMQAPKMDAAEQPQRAPANGAPQVSQLRPGVTLIIETDGHSAILTTPADKKKPLEMYYDKKPVTERPAIKGKEQAGMVGSGDEAADNLRNNKKLQAALPPEKLAEIVRLNASGTPVIVEPYSGPTGPTLTFRQGQSGQAQTQTPSAPPRR